ncbi:MAG: fatty acid desaturase family protein [Acidimicrobiales bacterium]
MTRPPPLHEIGSDLRRLALWRRAVACCTPFVAAAASLILLWQQRWLLGIAGTVVLSFVTYGSVSHDLVHRTYRLPLWLNHLLLSAMEMTALRSGTAYRLSHLNHHRYYPTSDAEVDPEAVAAGRGVLVGLLDGPKQQLRIVRWAWRHHRAEHGVALGLEAAVIVGIWATGAALTIGSGQPGLLFYAGLVTAGAWTIPLITVTIPHEPEADNAQRQTRAFRGVGFDALAFGHLYHLEHHLYPNVPHQRWRELAAGLDGYLAAEGIEPLTLGSWARRLPDVGSGE